MSGAQFLIDGDGWLRAVQRPGMKDRPGRIRAAWPPRSKLSKRTRSPLPRAGACRWTCSACRPQLTAGISRRRSRASGTQRTERSQANRENPDDQKTEIRRDRR